MLTGYLGVEMSQLQKAVDYFYANPHMNRHSVSRKFKVGAGNLYTAVKKHDEDVAIFNEIGVDKMNAIDAWFCGNPGVTLATAAYKIGISANTLRAAYRGQEIAARRIRLANGHVEPEHSADYRSGYSAGMEQAAKIAEMVGGEHGAAVATAIRAGV